LAKSCGSSPAPWFPNPPRTRRLNSAVGSVFLFRRHSVLVRIRGCRSIRIVRIRVNPLHGRLAGRGQHWLQRDPIHHLFDAVRVLRNFRRALPLSVAIHESAQLHNAGERRHAHFREFIRRLGFERSLHTRRDMFIVQRPAFAALVERPLRPSSRGPRAPAPTPPTR